MPNNHKGKNKPPRKFCCERVKICRPHGNIYREGDPVSWPQFPRLFRYREYASWSRDYYPGLRKIVEIHKRQVKHNAHHCVCCKSAELLTGIDNIKATIDMTNWCVNHKKNMIALPLWGHTFIWYIDQMGDLMENRTPPDWVNRPMHDSDHDLYKEEVDLEIQDIAKNVKKNKKAHKHRVKELKSELNSLVNFFKGEVKRRGKREGGTHSAWEKARVDKNYSQWVKPFSMANDGMERNRTFPCHEGDERKITEKISQWLEAIWFQQ